jgi:hypothetical protein
VSTESTNGGLEMVEGLHGFAIDSVDDYDNLEAVEGLGLHEERLETRAQNPRATSRRDDYAGDTMWPRHKGGD